MKAPIETRKLIGAAAVLVPPQPSHKTRLLAGVCAVAIVHAADSERFSPTVKKDPAQ